MDELKVGKMVERLVQCLVPCLGRMLVEMKVWSLEKNLVAKLVD